MAVAMENGGLIVPVIKNADGMNLIGIARNVNDLGKKSKIKETLVLTKFRAELLQFQTTEFSVIL